MKMKNYERLKGLIAAVFTPMHEDGNLHLEMIDRYADYIAASGIPGVFVCGTTGESLSLTVAERKAVLEKWIVSAKGRFKVIAHVGCNSQLDAMDLAEHAMRSGANAISAMVPNFFKPVTVGDLVDFFVPIAHCASDLPFYYYKMPSMTGVLLPVADFLVEGKKKIPNLVGVKFTHNNLMEMGECLALQDGAFEVLHGYDEILIAGLAFGAVAGVGSTYNYLPKIYQGIFKAIDSDDYVTARQLQQVSIGVVKIIIKYGGGVRGGKAIMKLIGIDCGPCRLPIHSFTTSEYQKMEKELSVFKSYMG